MIFFILIPNLIIIGYLYLKTSLPGSDHALHVSWIGRIKDNNHRLLMGQMYSINGKYAYYPQLYHWLLSYLPSRVYKEKFAYINVFIKIIEVVSFNSFLFFLDSRIHFDAEVFLYANIVVNVFPFSYAVWNAKNNGLSARGIGLVLGQLYTYFIIAYILLQQQYILFILFAVVFIILLTSQIAMQYVLLSLIFYIYFFGIYEIILLPILAIGALYLIMPKFAKGYIIGQFHHKRNYALFMAEIFILRVRPSIYRDFIYDFWVKLKTDFLRGVLYIFFNPIVEIIYGLPFLWFVLYYDIKYKFENDLDVLFLIIVSALGMFFITSFRLTRFFGEPQRYLEFVIPYITILYVLSFNKEHQMVAIILCFLFTLLSNYILNRQGKKSTSYIDSGSLLNYLEKNTKLEKNICISNDHEILRLLPQIGAGTLQPDVAVYVPNKAAFFENFYNNDINIISPQALKGYCFDYSPGLLVVNTQFYSLDVLLETVKPEAIQFLESFGRYELYALNNNVSRN